jgi:hypothetical protein
MKNVLNSPHQKFWIFFTLFTITIISASNIQAQSDPAPFECAMCCPDAQSSSFSPNCSHTNTLWSSDARHIPRTDARTIYVHANFIILRKSDDPDPDIQGNFSQNNAEHMAFLN